MTFLVLLVICTIGLVLGSEKYDEKEPGAYYKWFGLDPRRFDEQELQKAYRKLARQYHPDKNKDPGAKEIFQKVAKAFDVLNDKQKRELYNRGGAEAVDGAAGGSGAYADHDFASKIFESVFGNFFGGGGGRGEDDEDGFFGDFFGHGGRRRSGGPAKGPNGQTELVVSLETLFKGGNVFLEYHRIKVCGGCGGSGAADPKSVRACQKCKGQGMYITVEQLGPMFIQQRQVQCEACRGRGRLFDRPCGKCDGQRALRQPERLKLEIEPGMRGGEVLAFEEMADEHPDRKAGDLLVILREQEHAFYRRDGIHLYAQVPINLGQALLGFELRIPQLDGTPLAVKRRGITQNDHVERIAGRGMPIRGSAERRGDLFVAFKVVLPTKLSAEQTKVIQGLFPHAIEPQSFEPVDEPHDEL